MRKVSFKTGEIVWIDGEQYRIVYPVRDGKSQLIHISTNAYVAWAPLELEEMYLSGRLVFGSGEEEKSRANVRDGFEHLTDLTETERDRIRFRRNFLDAVQELVGQSISGLVLNAAIKAVEEKFQRKVSRSTYFRWLEKREAGTLALAGQYSRRGRKERVNPLVKRIMREVMQSVLAAADDRKNLGDVARVRMATIRAMVRQALKEERERTGDQTLILPSTRYFYTVWNEFPAFDRDVAKYGRAKARANYRGVRGRKGEERSLDVAQYDETIPKFMLIDEGTFTPLGKPCVCVHLDAYSGAPLGFYVGFEPASDLTIASSLRHACLPKAYVRREYPDIKSEVLPFGIPRSILIDNSLPQHGDSLADITFNLETHIKYTKVRTPWYKGQVERFFGVLNDVLLQELPGYTATREFDICDYDPTKSGCIGFRHFLYIFHKWLYDIYLYRSADGKLTPAERWKRGTAEVPPSFPHRSDALDAIFGIVRPGALDHRGVVFQNIYYYSEDLHLFRKRLGDRMRVKVKINPGNLAFVHVWEPHERCWIKVNANLKYAKYAENLSAHRHTLIQNHARRLRGSVNLEDLEDAEWDLHKIVKMNFPIPNALRVNQKLARAAGIGTDNFFNSLGASGELGPAAGIYQGQQMNPFAARYEHRGTIDTYKAPQLEPPAAPDLPLKVADASSGLVIPKLKASRTLT